MKELEFDCVLCGESNVQRAHIDTREEEQDITLKCTGCEEKLLLTVKSKHVVTWIDAE